MEFWQASQACELVFHNNGTLISVEHGGTRTIHKSFGIAVHTTALQVNNMRSSVTKVCLTTRLLSQHYQGHVFHGKFQFKLVSNVIMLSNHDFTSMRIYPYPRDGCTKISILCSMLINMRTPGVKRSNQTSISKMML